MNNWTMKKKVRKEYSHRKNKVLKSKLNSGNVVKTIDPRAVVLVMVWHQIHEMDKRQIKKNRQKDKKNNDNVQTIPSSC